MNTFFNKESTCGSRNPDPADSPPRAAAHCSLFTAHRSLFTHAAPRREGFTLAEMLVVIVIIAILIGMMGGAFIQARNVAKRGRGETQLRELVKAWNDYYLTYGTFPPKMNQTVEMSYDTLQPLFASDLADNPKGIAFLSLNIASGAKYCDPWGNPYNITFGQQQAPHESALRISVSFPDRERYLVGY